MLLTIDDQLLETWRELLGKLKGADRRLFMASIVAAQGRGGALLVQKKLGWDRTTVRKGLAELRSGLVCTDAVHLRGRKPAGVRLPRLEHDLRAMAEASSQTDPTFRTTQLYRRLTGDEARRRLIEELGYSPQDAPSARSLRRKLSAMGFAPQRVAKSKPLRKVPETDAIFETVHRINQEADADPGTVRLSIDTKTTVPIGNLSRGGKSRQGHKALDHDLEPAAKLTPFGVHRPDTAETWLCFSTGSVTADFMMDRLQEIWPTLKKTVILRIPLCSTPTTAPKTTEPAPSGCAGSSSSAPGKE
jgi:Rhodopirellula transposase DDE domain